MEMNIRSETIGHILPLTDVASQNDGKPVGPLLALFGGQN